jgi:hypothetical protein
LNVVPVVAAVCAGSVALIGFALLIRCSRSERRVCRRTGACLDAAAGARRLIELPLDLNPGSSPRFAGDSALNEEAGMSRDSKGWGGLAAVGGVACVVACTAGPLLAVVAGSFAVGAVLGVVAGVAVLVVLVVLVALRVRRRVCEPRVTSVPRVHEPAAVVADSRGEPVRAARRDAGAKHTTV